MSFELHVNRQYYIAKILASQLTEDRFNFLMSAPEYAPKRAKYRNISNILIVEKAVLIQEIQALLFLLTPIDTGRLISSMYIRQNGDVIKIGFDLTNCYYGLYVHEIPMRHPHGGTYKFLEQAGIQAVQNTGITEFNMNIEISDKYLELTIGGEGNNLGKYISTSGQKLETRNSFEKYMNRFSKEQSDKWNQLLKLQGEIAKNGGDVLSSITKAAKYRYTYLEKQYQYWTDLIGDIQLDNLSEDTIYSFYVYSGNIKSTQILRIMEQMGIDTKRFLLYMNNINNLSPVNFNNLDENTLAESATLLSNIYQKYNLKWRK